MSGFALMAISVSAETLDKIAAVVNDKVITENELQGDIAIHEKRLKLQRMGMPEKEILRKQVLNHSIDVALQLQIAEKNNVEISALEMREAIKTIATRNHLTLKQLKDSMAAQGLTWSKYKANIRKEMLISRVQQGVVGQIIIPDTEIDSYLKSNTQLSKNLYHIKDLVIGLPEAPSPEELKKASDKAKSLTASLRKGLDFSQAVLSSSSGDRVFEGGDLGFRQLAGLPDMFAKRVVNMKVGEISDPFRAPNGFHIIKLVEIRGDDEKKTVVLTRARQILLKIEPGMDPNDVKKKLNSLALQIKRGQSFATVAKRFSEDQRTKDSGGELGWVHKGELLPDFDKAMAKLKPGQMSQPIKTDAGWHLIKVEARKEIDDSAAFRREKVKQELYQRHFYEAVQNWLQQARGNSYIKIF